MANHSAEHSRPRGRGLRSSAGIVLPFAIFWSTLDRSLILPLIPQIADELGSPVAEAATAITAHAVAYAALQLLWGPLSARWGRIRVLAVSTALAALANVLCAVAPGITSLLIARTMSGGAFAATFAAVLTYFGDALPLERRPAAMSNLATATALGLAGGTLAAGALGAAVSWRWIFVGFAVVTALLVVPISQIPEARSSSSSGVAAQLKRLVRNGWALGVCVVTALEGVLLIGVFNLLPVVLQEEGADVLTAGLVTAAFGVAVVLVSQLMKLFVARTRPTVFIALGGFVATVAFVVLLCDVTAVSVLVAATLMGIGWALAHTTLQTWMTDAAAESRPLGMTLFSISLMLGGALGAAVGTAALGASQLALLFTGSLAGALLFTIVTSFMRSRYRESPEISEEFNPSVK